MADIRQTPYAGFLEYLAKSIMEHQPVMIAVVGLLEDGSAFTSTYGNCGSYDMGVMAFHLQADAMMEIMKANAGDIIDAAEEEEGETWQED